MPKKVDNSTIFTCSCGFKSKGSETIIKEKSAKDERKLEVIETDESTSAMPITRATCPKCDNTEAHFWEVQTRAADEPATKFLKCTKCKHTWRDYN